MKLSETQLRTLERLDEGRRRATVGSWLGTLEGAGEGSTLQALARKGLATIREARSPYPRLVGRITQAGVDELQRRRKRTMRDPHKLALQARALHEELTAAIEERDFAADELEEITATLERGYHTIDGVLDELNKYDDDAIAAAAAEYRKSHI